jgi:hypothetical protein
MLSPGDGSGAQAAPERGDGDVFPTLCEIVVQDAVRHDGAPQLRIAMVADRSPNGVAGALERDFQLSLDGAPSLRVRAAQLAHHFEIAAIGPPVERVLNGIHRAMWSSIQL